MSELLIKNQISLKGLSMNLVILQFAWARRTKRTHVMTSPAAGSDVIEEGASLIGILSLLGCGPRIKRQLDEKASQLRWFQLE